MPNTSSVAKVSKGSLPVPATFSESGKPACAAKVNYKESISGQLSQRDEQILKVATTVFARCGYRNTDVQEIADSLDIGKATIYRAFGTKEELFFATVDYGMSKLSARLAHRACEHSDSASASSMEEGIKTFLSFFQENPELVELLMLERSEFRDRDSHSYVRHWRANAPRWKERIEKSIKSGKFRHDLKAEDLVEATSGLCYGTIFINYFSNKKVNLESTAKSLVDILMFGVLSNSERALRKHEETEQDG